MDDSVRQLVRERAGNRCEYCHLTQHALPWSRFHIEHIRARQHHGTDDPANLALACHRCNAHKGPSLSAYDPGTNQLVSLFNPRLDQWASHFQIDDFPIVGLTPVDRATVFLLKMNDPDRIRNALAHGRCTD